MQNRYVGDIGDFGKHGLLRFLSGMTDTECPEPRLRLGLVWHFHHDEIHVGSRQKINYDGGHVGFLRRTARDDKTNYRNCDPDLWERLRDLVFRNAKCVHCAELSGVLPPDTAYYSAPLVFTPGMPPRLRREIRECWTNQALLSTRQAELVCFDPDNGVASAAQEQLRHRASGTKYAYATDLARFWDRGQSLVVYHHLGRGDSRLLTERVVAHLREGLDGRPQVIPLPFHRGTRRVFLVVPRPEHEPLMSDRIERFSATAWFGNGHFVRAH